MKKQLQGILYYFSTEIRYPLSIFWMILGAFILLTIILYVLLSGDHIVVTFNLSLPIYIFASIIGFITVKGSLPYLVKIGATRKHLFIGTVVYFFGLALFNSIMANLLYSVTTSIIGKSNTGGLTIIEGDETFHLHHLADILPNSSWLTRIVIDTSVSFFLLAIFFIVGLIFYRYKLIGGSSFIALFIFGLFYVLANGWLTDFFIAIFTDFSIVFFYQLFLVGVVIYSLSFLLTRRFTI